MEAIVVATEGTGFSVSAQPAQLGLASRAYLRCPNCNSTNLRKVSLAYQEGLVRTVARTRVRAVVVGGHGPDLLVARATTQGSQQSNLSKRLSPPVKWSYRKLILWWALAFLSIGWILFYTNAVTKNFSCCSVAAVDPFRAVVCSHVPTAAGSFLEAQSVHLQASLFSVGTLVPLRTLWHFNGTGLLELGNQKPRHALFTTTGLDC